MSVGSIVMINGMISCGLRQKRLVKTHILTHAHGSLGQTVPFDYAQT